MVEARVEYDYNAENVDELTLRTGDLITNVVQKDDGWWEGKLNGKYGLFPENFVKIFNKDQAKVQSDPKSNGIPFRTDKKRKCRVVYSYTPVNDDELELEVDSLIDVLEEVEEGWWRGILNGKMGVFPSNFVEELQDRPSSSRDSRNSKESSSSDAQDKYLYKDNTDSSSKDIKPKPVRGVGLRNIIFQEECSRIKQTQDSSTEKKGTPPKKPPPPTHLPAVNDAPVLPPKPVREQARVLFAYDACNDDELSLREGDIITVISKEIEDKGWWKGELNNKIGVFPDNFVEVITLPEPRLKKPERPSLINKSASSRIISSDVVEKTLDASPPLPDYPKKLSTEILKKDDRPERPEKPLIPPIPCKKPQIPPPLKKPQKPIAPPPPVETLTDDMKAKTQGSNIMETTAAMVDEAAFDSIELTSDKLTHLTATRVRHPHRRPPSHIFLKDTSSSVTDSQFNEVLRGRETKNTDHNSNSLSAQLNTHKEFIYENEEQLFKNEQVVDQERPTFPFLRRELPEKPVLRPPLPKPSAETVESQSTPAKTKPYGLPPKPSTLPKEEPVSKPLMQVDTRLNKTSGDDVSVVLELQQEIMHLKNQILNLQQNLDNCNATYSDKIEALSQELIAEKKIRISMQVEIEHLKKMVKEH